MTRYFWSVLYNIRRWSKFKSRVARIQGRPVNVRVYQQAWSNSPLINNRVAMVSRINRAGQAHPSATANTERTYRGVRLHTYSKEVGAVYGGSLYTDEMREVILRWWIRDQTISKRGSSRRNSRGTSARLSRLFLVEVTLLLVLVYLVVRVGRR